MEHLMNELDSAFKMISKIPVSGDNVDLMAAAREKLRHVYSALRDMNANQKADTEKSD